MAKTNAGLVEYAKKQLGRPYWYGTFGQLASASLLSQKKAQYPKYYNQANYKVKFTDQYGQKVHDCVGLIKGYLWCDGPDSGKYKYDSSQDVSANGMLNVCKEKGPISTMPEIPGILVFMNGHVGVYIGDGYVIEAKGHDYGVVRTALKGRGWVNWGKCPWITYRQEPKITETITVTAPKSIKRGSKGNLVKVWQIIIGGCEVDGDFGPITESQTKKFQSAQGNDVTGIVSTTDWKAGLSSLK